MSKKESQAVYDKRKVTVEPAFGNIKMTVLRNLVSETKLKLKVNFHLIVRHITLKNSEGVHKGISSLDAENWSRTASLEVKKVKKVKKVKILCI